MFATSAAVISPTRGLLLLCLFPSRLYLYIGHCCIYLSLSLTQIFVYLLFLKWREGFRSPKIQDRSKIQRARQEQSRKQEQRRSKSKMSTVTSVVHSRIFTFDSYDHSAVSIHCFLSLFLIIEAARYSWQIEVA